MSTSTTDRARATVPAAVSSFAAWVARWVEPRVSGLPRVWVVVWFPVLVVLVLGVLTALGISGSSTGNYWGFFGQGADPGLMAGEPRPIRTDEWLVQSSWIVSQVQQGFPVVNQTLPGGMDATIQNDLPSWDWSTLFRPHVWGFLVMPLAQGMAVRWWLPFAGLLVGAYVFLVTVMPRRPVTAALLAVALGFSPLVGWWFLPTTIFPYAWAFAVLVAVLWGVRSSSRWARWVSAGVAGYLTVTLAMSIYVPYAVPAVVVVAFVTIGLVLGMRWPALRVRRATGATGSPDSADRSVGAGGVLASAAQPAVSWRRIFVGLAPLVGAVVAAAVVLVVWVATRLDTVRAVLGTVYPGHRTEFAGSLDREGIVSVFGAPFGGALQNGVAQGLGPNQSEAAAPLMTIVFLVPVLVWLLVRSVVAARAAGSTRRLDWPVLSVLVVLTVLWLFLLVPGWTPIANLLGLTRSTDGRLRLAFDLLAVIGIGLAVARLDRDHVRTRWWVALSGGVVAAASVACVWYELRRGQEPALAAAAHWKVVAVLLVVAVVLIGFRLVLPGVAALTVATLLVGLGVNPLYRGVFELPVDTKAGRAIEAIEAKEPGARWVGIGSTVQTAMLVESGVPAYNGVQTYPPREMWHQIDPSGRYENAWNRLANVNWTVGAGEPVVTNPVRDQVLVTFDACSSFAQKNVQYVLSDVPVSSACLREVRDLRQGGLDMHIYRVD
ncbi:hypothetical protein [Curtobacterium sp. MCSS17_007]|uniref:DUF7657 domain-containing protein n=1 Tax=Curtobacterium sp. MCSS17_007 TaxID=2175646 RepID=UPI0011B40598|nr:hypothetical protein [Curtobacterium sp. MCSS17_007]WIE74622.1 hypothetical protein DEJ22_010090 [Curtobacterium sp. MCSS17_007]